MSNFEIFFKHIKEVLSLKSSTIEALKRLGISSLKDLLFYRPSNFKKRKIFPNLNNVTSGEEVILKAEIIEADFYSNKKFKYPLKFICKDQNGYLFSLVFFNKVPPFILGFLKPGKVNLISGKVTKLSKFDTQLVHPKFIFNSNLMIENHAIYPLTYQLSNDQLLEYIPKAFIYLKEQLQGQFPEWLPTSFKERLGFIDFLPALELLHKDPVNDKNTPSLKRLAFDEMLANQLSFLILKKYRKKVSGQAFKEAVDIKAKVLQNLHFTLTLDQEKAIYEIEQDQFLDKVMIRLLQGDVGSGKTLVALLTMCNVVFSGAQTALMAPTEVLARQHYEFFQKALSNTGISISLICGSTKTKEKTDIINRLSLGAINIIIGTHALFQEKVNFANLGYIIIDEQHRFGVEQRLELIEKGNKADVLVMSATPIPRSLNLVLFGDMECSKIFSKPMGRKPIQTFCMPVSKTLKLIESLEKIIAAGEKIYWICSLIEQNEESEQDYTKATDVKQRFEELAKYYPNKVVLIHGKMSALEKEQAMQEFKYGDKAIMVGTTVIEVGVDVKEATLIIIENAEKFGLAQLHQLRGRVGRNNLESRCILLYSFLSAIAKERLEIMKKSNDGFYIAEKDLSLRGGGEIFGKGQSGEQHFHFAEFDLELIEMAKLCAESMLESPNKGLITLLLRLFSYNNSIELLFKSN